MERLRQRLKINPGNRRMKSFISRLRPKKSHNILPDPTINNICIVIIMQTIITMKYGITLLGA